MHRHELVAQWRRCWARWARRGEWHPGALPGAATLAVGLILCGALIGRGVDYLWVARDPRSLTLVEQAMPLPAWGALFSLSAVLVLVGMAGRWFWPILLGAVLGAAAYTTLGLGILWGGEWDGVRGWLSLLALGGVWAVIAAATAHKRRRALITRQMLRDGELTTGAVHGNERAER